MALRSVCVAPCWPTTSSKRCGRYLRARTWYDTEWPVGSGPEVRPSTCRRRSHRDPDGPAAHVRLLLALLPSGPDAVRGLTLHRVRAAMRPPRWLRSREA